MARRPKRRLYKLEIIRFLHRSGFLHLCQSERDLSRVQGIAIQVNVLALRTLNFEENLCSGLSRRVDGGALHLIQNHRRIIGIRLGRGAQKPSSFSPLTSWKYIALCHFGDSGFSHCT